jgi:predicted CXXCH cytochrome family protein
MCHTLYENHAASGKPSIQTCLMCHSSKVTDSPEEEKIRQYRDRGEEIPWQRIYVAPDNVLYSHRRHVVVAGIECEECHGPIASQEAPPKRPLRRIKMERCIACHDERGASTDCLACHR